MTLNSQNNSYANYCWERINKKGFIKESTMNIGKELSHPVLEESYKSSQKQDELQRGMTYQKI